MSDLDYLRDELLDLKPVGANGFEGLVGEMLQAWVGVPVNLARAGTQRGRDGETGSAAFDLMFEAKRYSADVRLVEMAGEVSLACQDRPGLDLYVLATTAGLGNDWRADLDATANPLGVEVLYLDWQDAVPRLAAFLAAKKDRALRWFATHAASVDPSRASTALDELIVHPDYLIVVDDLARALSVATLGLPNVRKATAHALSVAFGDKAEAQLSFGQYLAPADSELCPVERRRFGNALTGWWQNDKGAPALALLGDEGTGKTWLAPQWWLERPEERRPIFLVASSAFARAQPRDVSGYRFLASLLHLTLQDSISPERWEARLRKWSSVPSKRMFLVLLDGLNEASSTPWSTIITSLSRLLPRLGGRLVLTCRPGFWNTRVKSRLPSSVVELPVDDFSDAELTAAAAKRNLDLTAFPAELKRFIANPRIFSIAAVLLDMLPSHELTIPRLLFEFWRHRLMERGDGLSHDDDEMRSLIVAHATKLRDGIKSFDVAQWENHAIRHGGSSAFADLNEIVGGRFYDQEPGRPGRYQLREDVLPFALGLLLVDELRDADADAREGVLAKSVDPVAGFDRIADVLAAATGIAMLDRSVADDVALLLLERWLALQNLSDDDLRDFASYARVRFDVYLELIERRCASGNQNRLLWPVAALRSCADDPQVRGAVDRRVTRWMGCWHLGDSQPVPASFDEAARRSLQAQTQRRLDRTAACIEALDPAERSLFDDRCPHLDEPRAPSVASIAPLLIAGRPLEGFAKGLQGWMLALEVVGRSQTSNGLDWVFARNAVDFEAASRACDVAANELSHIAKCRETRSAAARLFSIGGTLAGERRAKELFELSPNLMAMGSWSRRDVFYRGDVLDPNATRPDELDHARNLLDQMDPAKVYASFGITAEEGDLEYCEQPMARFDLPSMALFWRKVVATVPSRDPAAQRSLLSKLPHLSPLLENDAIKALGTVLEDLGKTDHPFDANEKIFVVFWLSETVLPHLEASAQLEWLRGLPTDIQLTDDLWLSLKPLPADEFEDALKASIGTDDSKAIAIVLMFAGHPGQTLSADAAAMIASCLSSADPWIRSLALRCTAIRDNGVLNRQLVGASWPLDESTSYERFHGSVALARASRSAPPPMPLARIAPEVHGFAASLGSADDRREWLRSLADFCDRVTSVSASVAEVRLLKRRERDRDAPAYAYWSRPGESSEIDLSDLNNLPKGRITDRTIHAEMLRRQDTDDEHLAAVEKASRENDFGAVLDASGLWGFDEAARDHPDALCDMGRKILDSQGRTAARLRNLGLKVAATTSSFDPELSGKLFTHLLSQSPFMRVEIGPGRIPFEVDALFAAADQPEITAVRRRLAFSAPHDACLEALAVAAALRGKEGALRTIIDAFLADGRPAAIAVALTLFGFMDEAGPDFDSLIDGYRGNRGLMASAAEAAIAAHKRNEFAHHWWELASASDGNVEMWGAAELMVAAADRRFANWFRPSHHEGRPLSRFASGLRRRLEGVATKVSGKRKERLCGGKPPPKIGMLDEALGLGWGW